jgi:hypothetical protein
MRVVMLQHQQHLLSGSGKGYEVIGTDQPNLPAGARQYNGDMESRGDTHDSSSISSCAVQHVLALLPYICFKFIL